jgi:hypothetical protein
VTFHDVAFTDDGPIRIPPEFVADAPRDPPDPGEVEVFAVEYRLIAGQSRQKGNRVMPAVRKPAKGVEVLYVTADGRKGAHKRFWRNTVERYFRASLGIPPSELEPLADERRHRVRDVLQVAHHDHLPEHAPAQPDRWPGFTRASALATDGGHPESSGIQSTERDPENGGAR